MLVARGQPKGCTGSILRMINGGIKKYGKRYFYPTQKTMLGLLERFHELDMARSTLNLQLNYLEDDKWAVRYSGYLSKKRDHGRYRPSCWYLTRKAIIWLVSQGAHVAEILLRKPVRLSGHHIVTHNRIIKRLGGLFGINQHSLALKGRASPILMASGP